MAPIETANPKQGLTLSAIWHDDDMLELEACVRYGGYSGDATAYITQEQLREFANAVIQFAHAKRPDAVFEAGRLDKAFTLRTYTVDQARHIAVHIALVKYTGRQNIWRLELEMQTEAMMLLRFADALLKVAEAQSGEAFLGIRM